MLSFTEQMLQQHAEAYKSATQAEFLVQAGLGLLSAEDLGSWLAQDRYYALIGYPRFASLLLSRLPLTSTDPRTLDPASLTGKQLSLLGYSLSNVIRETGFFTDTAKAYALDITSDKRAILPNTRAYVDLLTSTGASGSIEEGFILLWAMEKAYLDAWTFAKSRPKSSDAASNAVAPALNDMCENWTNAEFVQFVEDCREIADAVTADLQPGSREWKRCEEMFLYVLHLEKAFWPTVKA